MNDRLLRALAIGLKYEVTYEKNELRIEDTSEEPYGYGAVVDGDKKEIYLTGCYNSCVDWIELDLEKIKRLSEFVDVLTEEEDADEQFSIAKMRQLREHTGAGLMECKRALIDADGDIIKAYDALIYAGLISFSGATFRPKEREKDE